MPEEIEARLPCLLDRLIDEAPGQKADPAARRAILLKEYRQAVLRDLRWLLNSSAHLTTEPLYDYPEVVTSVLNYGTRDLAGLTSSSLDALGIESGLRDTILNFEPRIIPDSLRVRLVHEPVDEGKLAFEIHGQLWAFPHAERIMFRTEMDLETGLCDLAIVS